MTEVETSMRHWFIKHKTNVCVRLIIYMGVDAANLVSVLVFITATRNQLEEFYIMYNISSIVCVFILFVVCFFCSTAFK